MPESEFDLLIKAGRIVCPATGLDGPGAVTAFDDRRTGRGPSR